MGRVPPESWKGPWPGGEESWVGVHLPPDSRWLSLPQHQHHPLPPRPVLRTWRVKPSWEHGKSFLGYLLGEGCVPGGSGEKQAVLVQRMLQLMTSPWCDAPKTHTGLPMWLVRRFCWVSGVGLIAEILPGQRRVTEELEQFWLGACTSSS